ncbi:MAG: isoprenyl transferase [Eubacteriales bacterium]|jgi:undecaprenyl diphosphate synthase|nr:isoprenyl transferase [Eubacteriales bacterium]NLV70712.1 isoprenyl transferase [Clostridiales bacterium]HPF19280.1 isoprenyl transferase [Bacillota bacterium]HRV33567.1 isoprenyl transferase [Anaerovoracaceae bacterium]MDD3537328.1 isoprenyl transferase [Eubacteriales bacterium]
MTQQQLDPARIPQHVAIVMDGNGRWAKKRGLPRLRGHNAGMMALKEIVKRSSVLGISHLTVYAFSTENWKRPEEEVFGIFKLLVLYVQKEIRELNDNNVRVNIWGDWSLLPSDAQHAVRKAMETTKNNNGLHFNIALNYGGRAEILRAVHALCKEIQEGRLSPEAIDETSLSARMYSENTPDPDLIIRTGGEYRLSNFLIWQAAYSELVVTEVLWPDFSPDEFEKALHVYQSRNRRFGGLT